MIITDYKEPSTQCMIDGLVYTNAKLGANAGLALLPRVVRAVGERALRVIFSQPELLEDPDVAEALIGRIAESDDLPFVELFARLKCNKLRGNGQPGNVVTHFDEHFRGEYLHLFKVAEFVLRHNFLGFTLGSLWTIGTPAKTTSEEAPQESTGETSIPE